MYSLWSPLFLDVLRREVSDLGATHDENEGDYNAVGDLEITHVISDTVHGFPYVKYLKLKPSQEVH
jgi:hypothetical protein